MVEIPGAGNEKAPCEDGALSNREELALDRVLDEAFDDREQGVVLAHVDAVAGMVDRAALADQDRAREDQFAAVDLDAEALACGVAAVA
jgi:hypothetical protein